MNKTLFAPGKKAQDLPMQFIVIAAIAILVLILIVMFVIGGFRTEAVDSQTAANICASKCFTKQRASVSETKPTGTFSWDYCAVQNIKGIKETNCTALSPCTLPYSDGDCKVQCTGDGTASCT